MRRKYIYSIKKVQKIVQCSDKKGAKTYTLKIALTKTPLQILLLRLFAVNAWFSVSSWILHLPPHCPKGEDY